MMPPRIPVLGGVLLTLLCCVAFSSAQAACDTSGSYSLGTPSALSTSGTYGVTWTPPSGAVTHYELQRNNVTVYSGGTLHVSS